MAGLQSDLKDCQPKRSRYFSSSSLQHLLSLGKFRFLHFQSNSYFCLQGMLRKGIWMYLEVLLSWHGTPMSLGLVLFPTTQRFCCLPTRCSSQWNVLHDVRMAEEHSDP